MTVAPASSCSRSSTTTRACLVGPVTAEITPTAHNVWYGPVMARGTAAARLDFAAAAPGSWRYTERLLDVGAHVCVMGEFRSHSEVGDVNAAHRREAARSGNRTSRGCWRDSISTATASSVLRNGTRRGRRRPRNRRDADAAVSIARESVISQPTNGEPFLIAPLSEAALERREKLFAGLYLALGLVGVIVCAWAIRHAG